MHVIGLDLGGTKLASALFNRKGQLLEKRVAFLGDRQAVALSTLYKRDYKPCGDFEYHASGAGILGAGKWALDATDQENRGVDE